MENKTSKYFKYAIGEIVLVVIGILIALQINNWNENNKQKAELKGYLNNISKNIQSDVIDLNVIKSFRDSSKLGAQQFIKLANQNTITIDEFSEYTSTYLYKYNSLFDVYFKSDKSGFEALKNSGYLSKIQGTVIETELYKYYNLVTDIEQEEQSLNNFIEEMEYDMFKSNVVLQFITAIKDIRSDPTEDNLKKAHQLMNFPAFKGANFRVSRLRTILKSYETMDSAAKKVMSLIENTK
ncbi:DUF6090 family protein [Psychroserpens ponticola]|uniref:DUF6090 family protein n=1 Tax=Psychroserpens ponticola TaxID=2932268 RepID=A0ABY7RYR5_9FLAO|nr:DUF6090 family protein [Psychroserpens ponticola]WCO02217.1 DUF6090 family protein [Psychroserpens ponticola]